MVIAQVQLLSAIARLVEAELPKLLKYGKDSASY